MDPPTNGQGANTPANGYSFGAVNTTPEQSLETRAARAAFHEAYGFEIPSGRSNHNLGAGYVGQDTSARFNWAYNRRLRSAGLAASFQPPNRHTARANVRNRASGPSRAGTRTIYTAAAAMRLPGNVLVTGPLPNGAGVLPNGTSALPSNTGGQGHSTAPPPTSGNALLPMGMNEYQAIVMGLPIDPTATGLDFRNGMPNAQLSHASVHSGIPVSNTGTMPQGPDQSQSDGPKFSLLNAQAAGQTQNDGLQFSPWDTQAAEQTQNDGLQFSPQDTQGAEQNAPEDQATSDLDALRALTERYIEDFGSQDEPKGSL